MWSSRGWRPRRRKRAGRRRWRPLLAPSRRWAATRRRRLSSARASTSPCRLAMTSPTTTTTTTTKWRWYRTTAFPMTSREVGAATESVTSTNSAYFLTCRSLLANRCRVGEHAFCVGISALQLLAPPPLHNYWRARSCSRAAINMSRSSVDIARR